MTAADGDLRVVQRITCTAPASAAPGRRPGRPGDRVLVLDADGTVRLVERDGTATRGWNARLDPIVWPRLIAAGAAGSTTSPGGWRIEAEGIDPGPAATAADSPDRVLDTLVEQVSLGAVRTGRPVGAALLVHDVVSEPGTVSEPGSVSEPGTGPAVGSGAAFGTVSGAPACALVDPDGTFRLLSVPGGQPLGRSVGSGAPARSIALVPLDGDDLVVTGSDDGIIKAWRVTDGSPVHARGGPEGPVRAVAAGFAAGVPAGFAAAADGRLWSWATASGQELGAISGWSGSFNAAAVARIADLDLAVAGGDDGTVRVWELADGTALQTLTGHAGAVNTVALLPVDAGGLVASAGVDRAVRIWDLAGGTLLRVLTGHLASVATVRFLTVAGRLVVATQAIDGTLRSWDVRSGTALLDRPTGDGWGAGLTCPEQAGGPVLATCSGLDDVIRIWDAGTGAPVRQLTVPGPAVTCLVDVPITGRSLLAAGHADGSVRVWDTEPGRLVLTVPPVTAAAAITSLAPATDGTGPLLLAGCDDGTVWTCDLDLDLDHRAAGPRVLTPHAGPVLALATAALGDRQVLVSAGADATVRVWRADDGAPLACFSGHRSAVRAVAAGPVDDRVLIASGDTDGQVLVRDAGSGRQPVTTAGHQHPVSALAFGPAGDRPVLASGDAGGVVVVQDLVDGLVLTRLDGVPSPVTTITAIRLADDAAGLVVSHRDGEVAVWRLRDGVRLHRVRGDDGPALAALLLPPGVLHLGCPPDRLVALTVPDLRT